MRESYENTQRGGLTWGLHPLVVVRVDAHLVLFEVEGILTGLNGTQLMVAVQVRPPPQATVNDVRKALTLGDLQATIQRSDGRVNGRRIRWRGVRKMKAWLAVTSSTGTNVPHQSCLEQHAELRTLTWFGRGSCTGRTCPTVLSYLVNSLPIFQSNCCAQRQTKQQQRTHDKHGAGLVRKYQCGYCGH